MNELGRVPAYVSRYWRIPKPHATCLNCGQKFYHIIAHAMKCQEKEVIMSEQKQSLFDRYNKAVRAHPEAYVVVRDGDRLVTFKHECWLFAEAFKRMPAKVNGHFQLAFTAQQAEQLKSKFDILEV